MIITSSKIKDKSTKTIIQLKSRIRNVKTETEQLIEQNTLDLLTKSQYQKLIPATVI